MKLLVLLGSPRKGGNSEILARKVGEIVESAGWTVEYIMLNRLDLRPCQGCGGCDKTGICVVKDDMTGVYEAVDSADRVLMASPVYFYALSAQCKICGDRMQAKWARKYLLKERFRHGEGRKGYLISTAATSGPRIFECSVLSTRYIFDAMDLEYGGDLLVKGVDDRKAVLHHEDGLQRAEQFGRDLVNGTI